MPGLMGCHPVRGDTPAVQVRASHSAQWRPRGAVQLEVAHGRRDRYPVGVDEHDLGLERHLAGAGWSAGKRAAAGPVTVTNAGSPSDVPSG